MGSNSSIEWTDATWNPTTGCSRVSRGCDKCYAMRMARRLDGRGNGYDGTTRYSEKRGVDWNGVVKCHEDRLQQALRWRKRRHVFVNSMSDLFHPAVPPDFVDKVFAVMGAAKRHTFQVLTKRPERMAEYMKAEERLWQYRWPKALQEINGEAALFPGGAPENVWLGTSIEDGQVLGRADALREIEASVRFLSLEPLLGPLPDLNLHNIEWVIVGGESGPGARAVKKKWVTEIRDRCRDEGVDFFFKQWGGARKKETGRELEGRTWDEMPPVAQTA